MHYNYKAHHICFIQCIWPSVKFSNNGNVRTPAKYLFESAHVSLPMLIIFNKICHFIFFYMYLSYKTKITFYNNIFPIYFTSFSSLHSLLLVSFISFVDILCHIGYTAYTFFPFCFLF